MICVLGGYGFLGGRVMLRLKELGLDAISCSRRDGVDLRYWGQAFDFFRKKCPEVVINCAANQGGIAYQRICPAQIFYDNLMISTNTLDAAHMASVGKYVNIVSGCAYPDSYDLLSEHIFDKGSMHPSVKNYGITKRAAVTQAQCYREQYGFNAISLILINLYGPSDHFIPSRSHAMAALIRKFYEAKRDNLPEVEVWGTGRPHREWLYVDDAVDGILRAVELYNDGEPLNIAVGSGYTIADLAQIIKEVVDYEGNIVYDPMKPDGALCKIADITRMKEYLKWEPKTPIRQGIAQTLNWLVEHYDEATQEE